MPDNRPLAPRIFYRGKTPISERCVWCDREGEMSRSHVIPERIGGRFVTYTTCGFCNHYLGTKVESECLKNVYITAALVKAGGEERKTAYRKGQIRDEDNGRELRINKDGRLDVVPKPESDKGFAGSKEDRAKYFLKRFKKKHPGKDATSLEEFFESGVDGSFTFHDETYSTTNYPARMAKVKIGPFTRDPNPTFVFKVSYEFLSAMGLLSDSWVQEHLRQYYSVSPGSSSGRILFDDSLTSVVLSNTAFSFRQFDSKEDMPFKRQHYFVLRLTSQQVLYTELTLFGQLKSLFLLGKWEPSSQDDPLMVLLDLVNVMPFDDPDPLFLTPFPNLELKERLIEQDMFVNLRRSQLLNHPDWHLLL